MGRGSATDRSPLGPPLLLTSRGDPVHQELMAPSPPTVSKSVQALFHSFHPQIPGWSCTLSRPETVLQATTLPEVLPLLHKAWEGSLAGKWVALLLSYEAAPAFDSSMRTHPPGEFPLAWAAIFDCPDQVAAPEGDPACTVSPWTAMVSRDEYNLSLQKIQDLIAQGESYQVNYTVDFRAAFKGDDRAWYRNLALAQGAPYSAYLNLGRFRVLSLSPELFFRIQGESIETMPMKGTMERGRWPEEDGRNAVDLALCPKNRAENVMIVDLVRSDLGKVSVPGTVQAEDLFEVQRFRSVLQMVSSVRARLRSGSTLGDIFQALFPGGSVTGAPKVRTMEIIRDLEPHPRHIYTGALGFLRPGGNGVFSIPIRTVLLDTDTGEAEFRVGGGITADSTTQGEFEECRVKMNFLTSQTDAFNLLETILLQDGSYTLLHRHLKRLKESADYFLIPFRKKEIAQALEMAGLASPQGSFRVRLLVSHEGTPRTESFPLDKTDGTKRVRLGLARAPVSSKDVFLFHKTTSRAVYEDRLRQRPDCDDVVLFNERGELTETTRANLVLEIDGMLLTPPRSCGLLAGTFRQELLDSGTLTEKVLYREDLTRAARILLINSVHGWMEAEVRQGRIEDLLSVVG
jgi:para-aminobenzoate synthetase / 4-amino-4-deoxychorismate lyase